MIESTYHGYAGTSSGMPVVVENERPRASRKFARIAL
jgi:hypothetical protein